MDLEKLTLELSNPEYAGLSDQEAADLLNVANLPTLKPGSWATELTVLAALGPVDGEAFLSALDSLAGSNGLIARAVRWLRSTQGIDLGNSFVQDQLTALAAQNVITADSAGVLKSLGCQLISKAQSLGYGEIGIGAVRNARLLMEDS